MFKFSDFEWATMHFCPLKTLNPGWANSKVGGGKVKQIGAAAPISFLPTLFRKRAGAQLVMYNITSGITK